MSENAKTEQIEVGVLWKKERASQKFLSGNYDFRKVPEEVWNEFVKTRQLQVVVFSNKFKQKETHPDLRVYVSKPKNSSTPTTKNPAPATKTPAPAPVAAPTPAPAADDGEII